MIIRPIIVILIALIMAVSGCAGTDQKASDEKGRVFSKEKYLTATGSGDTETEAKNKALAELSNIFESRVYSETRSQAQSLIDTTADELFEKKVESYIRIISSVRLTGARMGKVWRDPKSQLYYATAILDRIQAGRRWKNELDQIESMMEAEYQALSGVRGKLPRLIALNGLMNLELKTGSVENRLGVVGFAGARGFEPDMQAVYDELAALKAQIKFNIHIVGKNSRQVTRLLSASLSENGLVLSDRETDADAWIRGNVEIQPVKLKNPEVYYTRAIVTVTIEDVETGVRVANISEHVRKGHIDKGEATRRAVQRATETVADKLVKSLKLIGAVSE